MAVSIIPAETVTTITCTKGINVGDFTFYCHKYGKIIVLSYYFTVVGQIAKDSVIATLSMNTNFSKTAFNDGKVRLQEGTKTVMSEKILTNEGVSGQIVGVVY